MTIGIFPIGNFPIGAFSVAMLPGRRAGVMLLSMAAVSLQLCLSSPVLAQARSHAAEGAGRTELPVKPKAADPGVAGGAGNSGIASGASSEMGDHTHLSREGGMERRLWLENGRIAEFGADGAPSIRAAAPGEVEAARHGSDAQQAGLKNQGDAARQAAGQPSAAAPGAAAKPVSPVFKDASGRLRALPGGVIVAFRQALAEEEARSALEAAGLVPLRQIGERMWMVDSPAGIASLELANRLQADGQFGFAQPNWWQPKATK
jgi:hypothetical protein